MVTSESQKYTDLSASITSLLFRRTGSDFLCTWWLIPQPITFSDTAAQQKEEQCVNTIAAIHYSNQKTKTMKEQGYKQDLQHKWSTKQLNDQMKLKAV